MVHKAKLPRRLAVLARELNAGRSHGALHCVIHVVDRGLHGMLMRTEMANREDDPFELTFFNVYEMCARVMLRNSLSAAKCRRSGCWSSRAQRTWSWERPKTRD